MTRTLPFAVRGEAPHAKRLGIGDNTSRNAYHDRRHYTMAAAGAGGLATRPRFASPQALYSAFPLTQETGKQAHGHPLSHPIYP
ncbi:MAG: hypothetical protein HP491_18550 [Nitrospira sp.]|nr:hypothetical protein [Nitrospira sp.]MBH0183517.1 hypothetical protein [Nitrospira sp.]MBH0186789.1 hypothetical protein [Nitrospira sp.]